MEWDVNYVAVVVATIAAMVIGAVWYMPAIAGKTWMAAIGKSEAEVQAGMRKPGTWVVGIILALIQMSALAGVLGWAHVEGVAEAIEIALVVWVGFVFTTAAMNVLYEGRPTSLYWVYGANSLITLVVAGAILGWWRAM